MNKRSDQVWSAIGKVVLELASGMAASMGETLGHRLATRLLPDTEDEEDKKAEESDDSGEEHF